MREFEIYGDFKKFSAMSKYSRKTGENAEILNKNYDEKVGKLETKLSRIYIKKINKKISKTTLQLAFGHATRSVTVENQTMIDKNFPIRGNAIFIIF